jgi:hypothetical protein
MDDIKMDVEDILWNIVDWICLIQSRDNWRAVVIEVEPSRSIKCQESISGCRTGVLVVVFSSLELFN